MRDGRVKNLTRRDIRREATRTAVIDAARKTFLERGYEGTTIKLIADGADVSPGTVLNAAPSKAALLIQILQEEYESVRDSLDWLEDALTGDILDRLQALLQTHLEAQAQRGDLFAAAIGHSWLWSDPIYEETFGQMDMAWEPIRRALTGAVEEGTLKSDIDIDETLFLLQDLYLGMVRRMRRDGLDAGTVSTRLRDRMSIVLDGLRA